VPSRIAAEMGETLFKPDIVMEGGSLDVNGRGTLITTETCLLNPNRNPQLNRCLAAPISRISGFPQVMPISISRTG
jgi:agmatine/peptidylarginine deiminase